MKEVLENEGRNKIRINEDRLQARQDREKGDYINKFEKNS